jgi:hypothetical protein
MLYMNETGLTHHVCSLSQAEEGMLKRIKGRGRGWGGVRILYMLPLQR